LAPSRWRDFERRACRPAIFESLRFCKPSRQRATLTAAQIFMPQVEARRPLSFAQMNTRLLNQPSNATRRRSTERSRTAPPPTSTRRTLFASLASLKGGEGRGEESNCLPLNKLSIFKLTLFDLGAFLVQIPRPSMSARWQAERPRTASCLNSQRIASHAGMEYQKDLFTRLPAAKLTQLNAFTPAAWAKA